MMIKGKKILFFCLFSLLVINFVSYVNADPLDVFEEFIEGEIESDLQYDYDEGDILIWKLGMDLILSIGMFNGSEFQDLGTEEITEGTYIYMLVNDTETLSDEANLVIDNYYNNTNNPSYSNPDHWDFDYQHSVTVNESRSQMVQGMFFYPNDVYMNDLITEDVIEALDEMIPIGLGMLWDLLLSTLLENTTVYSTDKNETTFDYTLNNGKILLNLGYEFDGIINISTGFNPDDWFLCEFDISAGVSLLAKMGKSHVINLIEVDLNADAGARNASETHEEMLDAEIDAEFSINLVYDSTGRGTSDINESIYTQWWFWVILIAAAVIGAYLILRSSRNRDMKQNCAIGSIMYHDPACQEWRAKKGYNS